MSRHVELERKYSVAADFVLPELRETPGCADVGTATTHTLHARYYDTEDLRLAARGITLRRRSGGHDPGWHLKLPADRKNARREIRLPLDAGPGRTVPAELLALLPAYVRGRPLTAVAEVDTRRIERELRDEHGGVLAELADDTVRARRLGRSVGEVDLLSWREIEVENVAGSADFVTAVGACLRRSGARESAFGSKLARTLDGDITAVARPAGNDTAGGALVAYLADQYERLLAYDPLVRLADHDDDSVHKMRVATRRFRALLRTNRRMVDAAHLAGLDAELRWLAGELGAVRDLEVLRARFARRLAELRGGEPAWSAEMASEERRARERLREALSTRRYIALLDTIEAFLAAPPLDAERAGRPPARVMAGAVTRARRKALRRIDRARSMPPGPDRDTALHRARKAAKRARYTADAAAPVLGAPAEKIARRAKRLQDVLGAHQDAITAAADLGARAQRPGTGAADAFVMGRLAEFERRDRERVLERLDAAARKAAKPGPSRALRRSATG